LIAWQSFTCDFNVTEEEVHAIFKTPEKENIFHSVRTITMDDFIKFPNSPKYLDLLGDTGHKYRTTVVCSDLA
jgi:hypothetical protein